MCKYALWCAARQSLKARACSPSTLQDTKTSKQAMKIGPTCLLTNKEPTYSGFLCLPTKTPNVPMGTHCQFSSSSNFDPI